MLNINAFRLVVHEKMIFEDLSKCSLFYPLLGPKRGQSLYFNKSGSPSSKACFLPSLVEIGLVVLEKKSFKGKSRRWTDAAPWHKVSYDTPI